MSKRSRIITLVTLSILIFLCLVLGITYAFMRNSIDNNSFTEISLSSCATITLSDENSINLSNSYPMSRNKALQTTPYTFTVSGLCEGGVLFNVYIASLANNTLEANNIHYIITNNGSKEPLVEGILSDATNGINDFNDSELKQISTGINGEYGNIYNLYTDSIHFEMEKKYDLYLYVDSSVTSDTMNQTFEAGLAIKAFEYDFATINDVVASNITNSSVTLTVTATAGQNAISKYYFSNDGGSNYIESTSNIYTFNDLNSGVDYDFKIYVVDEAGYKSAIYSTEVSASLGNAAEYIASLYTIDGENDLYYHDGNGTYGSLEAGDYSYRYAGANPNNYVCFGSDEASCPADNLYRIIGIFENQVKLIKADYAGSNLLGIDGAYNGTTTSLGSYYKGNQSILHLYYWNNSTNNNTWSQSNLNTVNLNQNYISNLGSKWSDLIAETTWQVGGADWINVNRGIAKVTYSYEVGSNNANITYSAKIGIMYASEYGYAASPANWNTNLGDYSSTMAIDNNWMHMGYYDWTITRSLSGNTSYSFGVSDTGYVYSNHVSDIYGGVRPSFYLISSVELSGGNGTQTDPYRIV